MKYEFEKLLRQRKLLIIVTIALIAVYISLAFSGSYDTFTGFSVDYFWEDEECLTLESFTSDCCTRRDTTGSCRSHCRVRRF